MFVAVIVKKNVTPGFSVLPSIGNEVESPTFRESKMSFPKNGKLTILIFIYM
jgi:hypothetical protein